MQAARSADRGGRARGRTGRCGLALAIALALIGVTSIVASGPRPVAAADPTLPPMTPGRHVYDYGKLFTPKAIATAEALAASIENAGGGRVVVYTDDMMKLPDPGAIAAAWHVDGILLTGWDVMGQTTLGATLSGRLTPEAAKYIGDSSSGTETVEGFATSTLARVDGLLHGTHVFDGAGILDAADRQKAETAATTLGQKLGAQVYVDIAMSDDDPSSTAFFNGADLSSAFKGTLVIALGVNSLQIGGYIDSDSDLWDAYETGSPWDYNILSREPAPGDDVVAEIMRAIEAVQPTPNPVEAVAEAAGSVKDSITSFFSDRTNALASLGGLMVAILSMALFWFARRRRRREPGYADDDSVLLPAPPAEMTPALAAVVSSPLDSTRAVTVALLDLAAHGRIAFYDDPNSFGQGAGIRVVEGVGAAGRGVSAHAAAGAGLASSRPLGPAEESLLEGLRSHAGGLAGISPLGFGELRPLFEQTAEQLERIAGDRGWLRLQTRSVSNLWTAVGATLLVAAGVSAVFRQPIALACLGLAGLNVLRGARRMPLPLRTPDGQMTEAMVDAYRRTLRRALAGDRASIPPWLANAEEAALWGYAWGLEGEVQAFVGRNVGAAMDGTEVPTGGDMASLAMLLQGMASTTGARPVGLDTDAIAATLGGLGRGLVVQTGDTADSGGETGGR